MKGAWRRPKKTARESHPTGDFFGSLIAAVDFAREDSLLEMSRYSDIMIRRTAIVITKTAITKTMLTKTATPKPAALTSLEALEQAAECLKVLAHPHRLRMVQMLLRARYTVGELAEACGIPSHMGSEHLRLMQRCGFLTSEKEGRKAFYQIAEPHLAQIMACIETRFDGATR
jgi:DNA-binding transcriptional ArsR family regulator